MQQPADVSEGTLLGGKVRYCQRAHGYRSGIEPVLLAAGVPACRGERVLEAGTGAGAGLLSLCTRVGGVSGCGLERDPALARLAVWNLAANGFADVRIACVAIEAWEPDGAYDHAFANPPWHAEAGTPSPDAARRGAKIATGSTLHAWVGRLSSALRHRGTLSLILPASHFAQAAQALVTAQCGEIALMPLWPKDGVPAKLVIVQGIRGGKGASRVLPGLVLHEADGSYTPAANDILREGAAIPV